MGNYTYNAAGNCSVDNEVTVKIQFKEWLDRSLSQGKLFIIDNGGWLNADCDQTANDDHCANKVDIARALTGGGQGGGWIARH